MTEGEQIRDFINVVDVARGFVTEAESLMGVEDSALVRNVGSGHPQTIRAFAEKWWDTWQASGKLIFGALPYREGEVMRYVPEI